MGRSWLPVEHDLYFARAILLYVTGRLRANLCQ